MIEAFEAGARLMAHARETDAQATIASLRAASAMLDGMAIESAAERRPEQVLPPGAVADAAMASPPLGIGDADLLSGVWPLVAATRARYGDGLDAPMLAMAARPGAPPAQADARVSASLSAAPVATTAGDGIVGLTSFLAVPSMALPLNPAARDRNDVGADTFNSWISRIVAQDTAVPDMSNGVPAVLPWGHPDVATPAAQAELQTVLAVLLGGDRPAGSVVAGGCHDWPAAASALQVLADPAQALPSFAAAGDGGGPMQGASGATKFRPDADAVGRWGMLPVVADVSDGAAGRWMSPPPPGGAPARPDIHWSTASSEAAGNRSSDREDRAPVVVHASFHLDGSVLAQAVSEHIVGAMNGPLGGTGGFDPRRSYTPVEG